MNYKQRYKELGLAERRVYMGYVVPLLFGLLYLVSTATNVKADDNWRSHWFLPDTPAVELVYPIEDREGDHLTEEHDNPFELNDPSIVEKNVEYDIETERYIITETVDGRNIKPPQYLTFEEYIEYSKREAERDYWQERANSITLVEDPGLRIKLPDNERNAKSKLRGFIGKVEIRPSGNVNVTLGGNVQRIDNPILPESARKQGGFDFDMDINMNVTGQIGDLVKLNLTYNTQANFDFENQIKLRYAGEEDDIIKEIEAGNVSFSLPTALIQGSQGLFGLRTKLQFGRLSITNVFSQQRSSSENLTIQNGAQVQNFEKYSLDYDENRHFFLGHYFRDNYNDALANLPIVTSQVKISQVEVWVTNKSGSTQDVRDVVAFADLGETDRIFNTQVLNVTAGKQEPNNNTNDLYAKVDNAFTRNINNVSQSLQNFGMVNVQDYERTFARKLSPAEYTINTELGYISLNQALFPDQVLGIAYQYQIDGEVFKVGDWAQQVDGDSTTREVLYLKMLKSTSARPDLPIWDLMMKNIYSIGAFQVNREDFRLELFYLDPGGGQKRYIPEGSLRGKLLINQLNLDNLNNQNDAQRDGLFDFIPGITINPQNGRIIFPVLEPFGEDLRKLFSTSEQDGLADNYVYDLLYDSTKVIAQQFPNFNRFVLKGTYKSSVSNEISLGAFNVPQGSVVVTAGGQQLTEGTDFTVDYTLGRVRIINEGILNAGTPINVSYENNSLFGFQTKTLFGTRLDYWISDNFTLGGTFMHLRERPFTQKVNIGDDPISNAIWGLDFNYTTEAPFLTWLVDKIPFYSTKEKSQFTLAGEMANFRPGHSKAIGDEGTVYIDDFEGSSNSYDLRFPAISWKLASTPAGASSEGGPDLFPESSVFNDYEYSYNRAKLAWYIIDPLFQNTNNSARPSYLNNEDSLSNPYTRLVQQTEVFPNRQNQNPGGLNQTNQTFDLAYYPRQRGPYNYENSSNGTNNSAGVNDDGTLKEPDTRWGGIMRNIDNTNFEASNVEFIEFWVMDPFINDPSSPGGELYFNLGNINEDVLRDSRFFYENGMPVPSSTITTDTTEWGRVPKNQPIVNAFDNDEANRTSQDVGYDGWNDVQEGSFYDSAFLTPIQSVVTNQAELDRLNDDPSSDNFRYYLDDSYDATEAGVLERYKDFNGPQGNSAVQGTGVSSAGTNLPDSEDLNRDNTLNESEEYFQYRIRLHPNMDIGDPFITDIQENPVPVANGTQTVKWFQFKIPISDYEKRVGNIQDFRSIRFMRMFMTGFDRQTVLRFARLELVRNQWRRYLFSLLDPGEYVPNDDFNNTFFNVIAVNIEENSDRDPINYVLPEGIIREQSLSNPNLQAQQNEQSISVQVCDLQDGDARAVFKSLNLDIRQYERIKMFLHAESFVGSPEVLQDGEVTVFLRLGSDFVDNYYEYEIPVKVTAPGATDPLDIWPIENEIDLLLDSLILLKLERNDLGRPINSPFTIQDTRGNNMTIVGNPELGLVNTVMLGIRNPRADFSNDGSDDGQSKCAEVWFNELRLNGFNESGGWAAMGRMEAQLADLGSFVFAANMHTIGYGQLEQKVDERFQDDFIQYDAALNLDFGKFFPEKAGIRIPTYASISQSFSTPRFDPYLLDVPLDQSLDRLLGSERRDYKRQTQDLNTIKSVNVTNMRIDPKYKKNRKPRFYDLKNLNYSYAFTRTELSNPLIEQDLTDRHKGSLAYSYSPKGPNWQPFKKLIKSKSKWFAIIKDFNFNPFPTSLTFSTDLERQFGETIVRSLGDEFPVAPTYNKYFTWDRFYGVKFQPFKSLSVDFSAVNNARIDEPFGRLDTEAKRDTLWDNFWDGGRTTKYSHSMNANYNVPINKIPIFKWVTARAGYQSTYAWTAGPLVSDGQGGRTESPFGNVLNNSNSVRLNGELNFKNLYNEARFLKPYNSSRPKKQETKDERGTKIENNQKRRQTLEDNITKEKDKIKKSKGEIKELKAGEEENKDEQIKKKKAQIKSSKKRIKKLKKDKKRIQAPENPIASPLIRPLLALKRVSVNYSENKSTILPGYTNETRFLGQDKGFNKPGADFIFGIQPDRADFDRFAANNWLVTDTLFNNDIVQNISKNLNAKAVLEPFRDFRVDLTVTRNESTNYTERFKVKTLGGPFEHLNPITTGSYSVSFIAVKTMFNNPDDQGLTQMFRDFEANRRVFSQLFADRNPNSTGLFADEEGIVDSNYREGYGPNSRDILIPSFIAAYTGKDIDRVKQNPFKTIPLPNWRLTYNGLGKLPSLKKVFKSVNITHAYNSTFTVSSFISVPDFEGDDYFTPSREDTATGDFFSLYNIPQITISEQFAPLIGIDITWANGMTTNFEFKKSRNLSMSFIDYRLNETRSTAFDFGFGYTVKNVKLPIKRKGKKIVLKNDLRFQMDMSFTDNVTLSQRLDQDISEPTTGSKSIRVSPFIQYEFNKRLRIKIFLERTRNIPATSQSPPITNTRAGVNLQFTLTPQ